MPDNIDPKGMQEGAKFSRLIRDAMNEAANEGRDLTDEVAKLTKSLYGTGEAASEVNKIFRDTSRMQRKIADGFMDILEGTRKQRDVEKDIKKAAQDKNRLINKQADLVKKAGGGEEALKNLREGKKIQYDKLQDFSKLSDGEKKLLRLLHQKIENHKKTTEELDKQGELIEKGNTIVTEGLSGFAQIADKLGMGFLEKPLTKGAEAARIAAINGEDLNGQLKAATEETKKLIAQMIILAAVTGGLHFEEEVTSIRRTFGIAKSDARILRNDFTSLARETKSWGDAW